MIKLNTGKPVTFETLIGESWEFVHGWIQGGRNVPGGFAWEVSLARRPQTEFQSNGRWFLVDPILVTRIGSLPTKTKMNFVPEQVIDTLVNSRRRVILTIHGEKFRDHFAGRNYCSISPDAEGENWGFFGGGHELMFSLPAKRMAEYFLNLRELYPNAMITWSIPG